MNVFHPGPKTELEDARATGNERRVIGSEWKVRLEWEEGGRSHYGEWAVESWEGWALWSPLLSGQWQWHSVLYRITVLVTTFNFLLLMLGQVRLYCPDVKVKNPSVTRSHEPRERALQLIDEFFLVMVRLRLGVLEMDLGHRFNVGVDNISWIFVTWTSFLDSQLRPLITWPSRSTIQNLMPPQCKKLYRCIIDCTETSLEATYSTYRHHNTFKGFVWSNNFCISYSISDKQLTRLCGFFDYLEPGDSW